MNRPICSACNRRLVAVNYIKEKKRKVPPKIARWMKSGFKKKLNCDRCGFYAKSGAQILVFHMDGDLNNCALTNLGNVCLNCSVEITKLELPWRVGDLIED